jgi:DNA-directed RNA polymerase subunit RPC12/RpoP
MMKRLFYIDYPQEHFEGQAHRYRCAFCKQETTKINGRLEGHLPTCDYRIALEKAGFEYNRNSSVPHEDSADEVD